MPYREERVYAVYILASKRNGTLYVGVTNDLISRTLQHRSGTVRGFTQKYGVKTLVWYEWFGDVTAAIQREKTMKKWPRAWKLNVIERANADWRDLLPELMGCDPETGVSVANLKG
jgi:putative endonuclease